MTSMEISLGISDERVNHTLELVNSMKESAKRGEHIAVVHDAGCAFVVDENGKHIAELCGDNLVLAFAIAINATECFGA